MPKAEAGSLKALNSRMKAKGLQRLRWYCQVCEKQCRDQNAFKQHCLSESHTRQMILVGEDPKKHIENFSKDFLHDFVLQLRTAHGEKAISINKFYQEYIANKEHIHMNATKWPSLTEFAKYLGREGICRVEENEKGIHIAWIDNSPDALRRQEALRRKEAQDRGNEENEQLLIQEQIKRAQKVASARGNAAEEDDKDRELRRQDGEKITLSFGAKPAAASTTAAKPEAGAPTKTPEEEKPAEGGDAKKDGETKSTTDAPTLGGGGGGGLSLKMTAKPQTKNVFAAAKKNALAGGAAKKNAFQQPKKMSEAERIMKEDMERLERKRTRDASGSAAPSWKKQRTDR